MGLFISLPLYGNVYPDSTSKEANYALSGIILLFIRRRGSNTTFVTNQKKPLREQTLSAELRRRQETLHQVIESISSELELRPLLTRIVRHACELLGADGGMISLVDAERSIIRTEAVFQLPPEMLGHETSFGVGLAGLVVSTGRPQIFDRYGDIPDPLNHTLLDFAVIGIPIIWREQVIGFFGVGAAPPYQFDDADAEVLSLFAKHAGVAIENARLFTETQRTLDETRLLYQTSQRLAAALDEDEAVGAYLSHIAAGSRYACYIGTYEDNAEAERLGHKLVRIRGFWHPQDGYVPEDVLIPEVPSALDAALDAGETVTIRDMAQDPRVSPTLNRVLTEEQRLALALVPLIARGKRIGVVVLSHKLVHDWTEDELRPYQITAAQLTTALDRSRQMRMLADRGRQVAILKERERLGGELHDSVTQLLFSLSLIARSVAPAWRRAPAEGEQRLQRVQELSREALTEMRAFLADLRPLATALSGQETEGAGLNRVRREGLIAALSHHVEETKADGLKITPDHVHYVRQLPAQEEALYRIAQEALHNALKHAGVSHVRLRVWAEEKRVYLSVEDSGAGFSSDKPAPAGLGMTTMRERAEALGGSVSVLSSPGNGTTVLVNLPRRDFGQEEQSFGTHTPR